MGLIQQGDKLTALQVMQDAPVIPVIVLHDVKHAVALARALVAGGIRMLEVTLRTPQALACLEAIAREVSNCGSHCDVLVPEVAEFNNAHVAEHVSQLYRLRIGGANNKCAAAPTASRLDNALFPQCRECLSQCRHRNTELTREFHFGRETFSDREHP